MASDRIVVRGAREHNLKNVDLEIPRDQLVVITGLSGSGKSSLAFDTIYAEGQRRYVESLSAYARQFLEQMEKPEVDSIEGLSPAISIEQKTTSKNPRSTVGTVTEIYDYLRVLFARVGVPYCPSCERPISAQTVQQMVDRVMAQAPGTRLVVLAPVVRGRKGEYKKLFFDLGRQGFTRVRVNGAVRELGEEIELDKKRKHTIEVIVDRLVVRDNLSARLADSLETALRLADGVVLVEVMGESRGGSPPLPTVPMLFSERLACAECGVSLPEVSPRMFSFNNPYGACPECGGLGSRDEIDPERVVPNPARSLKEGALAPWAGRETTYFHQTLQVLARRHRFSLDTPWEKLKAPVRDVILRGERDNGFEGVIPMLERRYRETTSEEARAEIQQFVAERPCPACGGARLRRESLGFKIGGRSIADVVTLTIKAAAAFFDGLALSEREAAIARRVLKEIRERLGFLANVGLDYLTLDRPAGTLSGGEGQRIRLATQIGSSLVGVLYILDEPSIGLHQRDNRRLLDTLRRLRDLGNTVLVVEHDEQTIRSADFVLQLGPRAGEAGGPHAHRGRPARRQGRRHRPVAHRPHTAQQPRHLHRRLHVHPRALRADAGGADARLPARALLVQRQGRALRGVPGRRPREDRDALPARRLRHLRRVQGQALQPRDARRPLQRQEHRRSPRHDRPPGPRVLRGRARHQVEAADPARRRPRLHPPRAVGHHALGRGSPAREAGDRALSTRDGQDALHPRRADDRTALRRHREIAGSAQPARGAGQHRRDHRAQPGRHQDRRLGD